MQQEGGELVGLTFGGDIQAAFGNGLSTSLASISNALCNIEKERRQPSYLNHYSCFSRSHLVTCYPYQIKPELLKQKSLKKPKRMLVVQNLPQVLGIKYVPHILVLDYSRYSFVLYV